VIIKQIKILIQRILKKKKKKKLLYKTINTIFYKILFQYTKYIDINKVKYFFHTNSNSFVNITN